MGRPRKIDPHPVLTIAVSPDLMARLTRDAASEGRTLAQYCATKLETPDMLPAIRELRRDLDRQLSARRR